MKRPLKFFRVKEKERIQDLNDLDQSEISIHNAIGVAYFKLKKQRWPMNTSKKVCDCTEEP